MTERPVCFGVGSSLMGVRTDPTPRGGSGRPAFLFLNAGMLPRIGPSRVHVSLARALAEAGFASLRFDFSGMGDSGAPQDGKPFVERSVSEVGDAIAHMESAIGARSFVVLGLCSGAEVAHAAAVRDARVVGLVPLDGHLYPTWRHYLHRYAPRLVRGRSWLNLLAGRTYVGPFVRALVDRARGRPAVSRGSAAVFRAARPPREAVERDLRQLVHRRVRMLQVFTGGIEDLCTYRSQFTDAFRSVDFGRLLAVEFFPDADHTFTSLEAQRRLVETVVSWAEDAWPTGPAVSLEPPELARSGRRGGERVLHG